MTGKVIMAPSDVRRVSMVSILETVKSGENLERERESVCVCVCV